MNYKLLSIFIAILLAMSGCAKNHNLANENILLVDVGAEGASVDPARAENAEEFRIVNDLFAGLVDFDQANKPIPGMAYSWDISPDGKTYTFHLRNNLKFSDGTPITANDFIYSWQRLVEPKTASAYNFLLAGVINAEAIMKGDLPSSSLGVSAPDNQTVIVQLVRPMNEFLVYMTAPAFAVVPKQVIDKFGKAWTEPQNIVTSGAYVLKEHVVNGYTLVQKNLNYYDAANVHIYKVKYFPFIDTSVAISTYKTGGLDTTWKNIPIDRFELIKRDYPKELHVTLAERSNHLSFNLKLPKYANNLKLRQALTMAIDREVLTNKVLKSGQQPQYSIVTPTIENGKYADVKYQWANWPRDKQISEAKLLYKEAGFGVDHPLKVTLSYYTNDINKKTSLAIAAMWKSILGVEAKIVVQELKSFIVSGRKGDFDIRLSTWGADYNSVTTYTPLY
nr:peptide ABC transporter substrate-binding protein [Burkholderiales bacterium]